MGCPGNSSHSTTSSPLLDRSIFHIGSIQWAPEAGIIAVGRMVEQPVVHEGAVTIRRRMRLTMSCDHRVIDGATGARFLQTLKGMLENPLAMVY